jgi:N-acetylmuramoyl-L-alanine amidase
MLELVSLKTNINRPHRLILHCSDTPDDGDRYGFKDINEWHKENGWLDHSSGVSCGYHYVIRRTGVVETGRPETSFGAHCRGHNTNTLGICYIGTAKMTQMQVDSLINLYKAIYTRHHIPPEQVYGHYEFNSGKKCPNQDMAVIRTLLART